MVDFKKKLEDKKSTKGKREAVKDEVKKMSYADKILYMKKVKKEKEESFKNKPAAGWDKFPRARWYRKQNNIFISKFSEVPDVVNEIESPDWNESDENYLVVKFHYVKDGVPGLDGRKSPYIYCEKTFDRNNRCALCETYTGTWRVKISKLKEKNEKSVEAKTLADAVVPFKATTQNIYPILNLSLINLHAQGKAPTCFMVDGELDMKDPKCQKCVFQDPCYRKGFVVELANFGNEVKDDLDKKLCKLYKIEDPDAKDDDELKEEEDADSNEEYDFEGDHTDPKAGVVFTLTKSEVESKNGKTRVKYGIKINKEKVGAALPKDCIQILKDTSPSASDLEHLFESTHSYAQQLTVIPKSLRKYLEMWLSEAGLDMPSEKTGKKGKKEESDYEDDSDEDQNDSEDEESEDQENEEETEEDEDATSSKKKTNRKNSKEDDEESEEETEESEEDESNDTDSEDSEESDNGSDDDENEDSDNDDKPESKPSKPKNSNNGKSTKGSEKQSVVLPKECFADSDVYNLKSAKCKGCKFVELCGDVIGDELELDAALQFIEKNKKKETAKKVNSSVSKGKK